MRTATFTEIHCFSTGPCCSKQTVQIFPPTLTNKTAKPSLPYRTLYRHFGFYLVKLCTMKHISVLPKVQVSEQAIYHISCKRYWCNYMDCALQQERCVMYLSFMCGLTMPKNRFTCIKKTFTLAKACMIENLFPTA
jgi:hypothetical protein